MKSVIHRIFAVILSLTLLVTAASALSVEEALELLDAAYLREIPEDARNAETLDELFYLLGDPYTYYMNEEEYYEFLYSMEGTEEVVGIGVQVQFTPEGILIVSTISGGSAEAAGLQAGDLIVAIEDTPCVPAEESHQSLITGPIGSYVTITVLRDGVTRNYTLLRQRVVIRNTEFTLLANNVGYIDCNSFGSDTGTIITEYLQYNDANANCWVLDLRSNSGGYSNAAVSASGAFSGPGAYLFLRDKLGNLEYYVYSGKTVTEDAVVVLMDGGSASASEALAANIRDTQRGILVGTRTFGKGVAQVILDGESYPDRFDNDALKVTAYRFYSTNGTTTDQIGVIPTLMTDNQSAYDIAMALCGSFRNDYVTEGQMMLQIAGQYYFIDPASMSAETASALLAALPPVAQLYVGAHTYNWEEISPEQAAELLNTSYSSRYFSDVSSSPYADEINTLATYYLLLGDGKGHFMPENQLTRAQVCAMLSHLLGVTYSGPSQFSDVDPSAWYADEVNAMAYLGFVEGVGNGRFQPDSVLTQQEFFTILGRMARYLNFNVDNYAATFYDDNGTCLLDYNPLLDGFADWAKEETALLIWSSEALSASGSMLFTDPEHLTPTAPISREEAAACMYRMLAILDILPA